MSDAIILIPTYNEKENISRIIHAIFALPIDFHVLIIDDNSPDGTATIVKQLQERFQKRLFIEERAGKLGLGTAYIHGFKWALKHNYDYIFEMDADFSHNPNDLLRLYNACKIDGADVAVGSRYTTGGKVRNWPLSRILISYFASVYARMITWMPVKDTTAGFICYKKEVLKAIDFSTIAFVGYAFQIEMKYAAFRLGFKIKEVPITFVDRKEGKSKMSGGIVNEAVWGVLKMRQKNYKKD